MQCYSSTMHAFKDFRILLLFLLTWMLHFKSISSLKEENMTATEDYFHSGYTGDYEDFEQICEYNMTFHKQFMPPFFSIICLVGLLGNFLVIVTFLFFKRIKTMTDTYLLNLAFADLLFALSLPLWAVNATTEWMLGLFMCKGMHTVYQVSFYSSMLLLSCISVDRYFAIAKAVSAYRHRSRAMLYGKVSTPVIWVLAIVFATPEMVYTTVNNNTCTQFKSGTNDPLRVGVQTSQIVLGFVLPLLIMGFCYLNIVQTLCQARSFERNKAINVIIAVVATFLVCQVPYNVVLFVSTIAIANGGIGCDYDNRVLVARNVTQCVAFLRCCLNPFVYAFVGVKFRRDLLKLLYDLPCVNKHTWAMRRKSSAATDTETTNTNTHAVM